jgi:phage terminase large subunit
MLDTLIEEDYTLKEAYKPTCTKEEFPGYVWLQPADGRPPKEEPLKVNDHGMDAARYLSTYLDTGVNPSGYVDFA